MIETIISNVFKCNCCDNMFILEKDATKHQKKCKKDALLKSFNLDVKNHIKKAREAYLHQLGIGGFSLKNQLYATNIFFSKIGLNSVSLNKNYYSAVPKSLPRKVSKDLSKILNNDTKLAQNNDFDENETLTNLVSEAGLFYMYGVSINSSSINSSKNNYDLHIRFCVLNEDIYFEKSEKDIEFECSDLQIYLDKDFCSSIPKPSFFEENDIKNNMFFIHNLLMKKNNSKDIKNYSKQYINSILSEAFGKPNIKLETFNPESVRCSITINEEDINKYMPFGVKDILKHLEIDRLKQDELTRINSCVFNERRALLQEIDAEYQIIHQEILALEKKLVSLKEQLIIRDAKVTDVALKFIKEEKRKVLDDFKDDDKFKNYIYHYSSFSNAIL